MECGKFLLALLGVLLCPMTAPAMTHYNDGGHHIIGSEISDGISIDYETPSMGTVLEIVETGETGNIYAYESSTFILNKGDCGYVYLYDNSEAFIDGSHGRLALSDNATMQIYYSSVTSSISVGDSAEVILYGNDFTINGQAFNNGTYAITDLPSSDYGYSLRGNFENGNPFNYHLDMFCEDARITLIPEPATLLLLGLGGLFLRKKVAR